MANENLDRLISQINTSPTAKNDYALWQVITQLIRKLKELNALISASGSGSTINNITNINQFLDIMSDSGGSDDGSIMMISSGSSGSGTDAFVPYFIAAGETFTVPEFKQALFAMTIDVEGILTVDGYLIEVD